MTSGKSQSVAILFYQNYKEYELDQSGDSRQWISDHGIDVHYYSSLQRIQDGY